MIKMNTRVSERETKERGKVMRKEKGITLVALVITIIIMLILVAVVVYAAFSENGLIARSREAADRWRQEQENEMALGDVVDEILGDSPLTLVDDTGRPELQSLILVYEVSAGDTVEVPIDTTRPHNIQIDWGDGNLDSNDEHTYMQAGTYDIKITGTAERFSTTINYSSPWYMKPGAAVNLVEIKQWGVLEVKEINCVQSRNLERIASPTVNSFNNLERINFSTCEKLETIPENLFANCPRVTSLYGAFEFCRGIRYVPSNLFANCVNVVDFSGIFNTNQSLTSIPNNLFANCVNAVDMSGVFASCSNIQTIPANLFANCPNVESFSSAFAYCDGLTSIPANLFANCQNARNFDRTFQECTSLTTIPANLFASCIDALNFQQTFSNCTDLSTIPANLFVNCNNVTNFIATFQRCTSLTGNAINLWQRVPDGASNGYEGIPDGLGCYHDCEGLTDFVTIPSYWTQEYFPPIGV